MSNLKRRMERNELFMAEANELASTQIDDMVNVVREILDISYLAYGNLLELGVLSLGPMQCFDSLDTLTYYCDFQRYQYTFFDWGRLLIKQPIKAFLQNNEYDMQLRASISILQGCCVYLMSIIGNHGLDNLFGIIHNSNMEKLWPDKRPRFDPKRPYVIIKPGGWVSPQNVLEAKMRSLGRE